MRVLVAGVAVALIGSACTVLTSELPSDLLVDGRAPNGIDYMLPKGVVTVTLFGNGTTGIFALQVSKPEFIPDPKHRYFLRYRPHPTYDDVVTVTMVPDGRPFLKSIASDTTDRTSDILVNLAKAASFGTRGFQSFGKGDRVIGQVIIDPSQSDEVDAAREYLESQMVNYISERHAECERDPPEDDNDDALSGCAQFAELASAGDSKLHGDPLISLSVSHARQTTFGLKADCTVGVCYRPKEPYLVTYSVAGVTNTKVIEIPNASDLISIDIRRAFLVQKVQSLEFDDEGFLTAVKIKKDSELLAAAKLPLAIADAVADGLQLRIDYTQKNTEIAESEADLIRQQSKLSKAQQDSKNKFQSAEEQREKADAATSYVVKIDKPPAETPSEPATPAAPSDGGAAGSGTPAPAIDPDQLKNGSGQP